LKSSTDLGGFAIFALFANLSGFTEYEQAQAIEKQRGQLMLYSLQT